MGAVLDAQQPEEQVDGLHRRVRPPGVREVDGRQQAILNVTRQRRQTRDRRRRFAVLGALRPLLERSEEAPCGIASRVHRQTGPIVQLVQGAERIGHVDAALLCLLHEHPCALEDLADPPLSSHGCVGQPFGLQLPTFRGVTVPFPMGRPGQSRAS